MLKLNQIELNKKGIVINLSLKENFKRRVLDLGIVPGVEIKKIIASPFKRISAYDINGSLIAIRDIDAENIEVEYA